MKIQFLRSAVMIMLIVFAISTFVLIAETKTSNKKKEEGIQPPDKNEAEDTDTNRRRELSRAEKNAIKLRLDKYIEEKGLRFASEHIYYSYLRKKPDYLSAIYAIEYLFDNYPDKNNPGLYYELYGCHLMLGEDQKAKNDLVEFRKFLRKRYNYDYVDIPWEQIPVDEQRKISIKVETEIILSQAENPMYTTYFRKIIYDLIPRIDQFLHDYPDADEETINKIKTTREKLIRMKKARAERNRLIKLRKQQINDYLRQLEKLLVQKDEKKLREFLEKHVRRESRVSWFMIRYKKGYFGRDFDEINFAVRKGPFGKKYSIDGDPKEWVHIHLVVNTSPSVSGKECPEKAHTNKKIMYCWTGITFNFDNDIYYID